MDFFKLKKFRKAQKPEPEKDLEDKPVAQPEESKSENARGGTDIVAESEEDDDDFITNEVKRRLKELRRNSFMALIPEEESCPEEEEDEEEGEGETNSIEWRDVEAEGRKWWSGFDTVYEKYCERMLFFDRMILQQLKENGKHCYVFIQFLFLLLHIYTASSVR